MTDERDDLQALLERQPQSSNDDKYKDNMLDLATLAYVILDRVGKDMQKITNRRDEDLDDFNGDLHRHAFGQQTLDRRLKQTVKIAELQDIDTGILLDLHSTEQQGLDVSIIRDLANKAASGEDVSSYNISQTTKPQHPLVQKMQRALAKGYDLSRSPTSLKD